MSLPVQPCCRQRGRLAWISIPFAVGARVRHVRRGGGEVTEHMEDGRTRVAFDLSLIHI